MKKLTIISCAKGKATKAWCSVGISLASTVLILFLPGQSVIAQCGWFAGAQTLEYLGCVTDAQGQAIGRKYLLGIQLHCYNTCGAALPGYPFAQAVNPRTGFRVTCWAHGCDSYRRDGSDACGGFFYGTFTLRDADFEVGDLVRIDTWAKPSSSDPAMPVRSKHSNWASDKDLRSDCRSVF